MRILSVVNQSYYGRKNVVDPGFLWFTEPLRRLGHVVDHFDHQRALAAHGLERCGEQFLARVRRGGYDLVLYMTSGRDWMPREAIALANRMAPIIAWNSDDDWQWDSYSRLVAPLFTRVVTTYRHIYVDNLAAHPNLLLSQWGCLDTGARPEQPRDLDFTFVGQIYRNRVADCRRLGELAGLRVYGVGAARVRYRWMASSRVWKWAVKIPGPWSRALPMEQVHALWNRSRISYTPLSAAGGDGSMQIKARVFEMGLSGTMMLCQHNPEVDHYYEPGREYIPYASLDECADKARYYLAHESHRQRIASAYRARTMAEHLWEHRFQRLLSQAGFSRAAA